MLNENRFALNTLKLFTVLKQENEGPLAILDIKVIPSHQAIPDDPRMQRFILAMKKVEKELGI